VRVDIIDVDDQAGIGDVSNDGGVEIVLSANAMQPDGLVAGANFTVNGLAIWASIDSAGSKPKCPNQEVVCGLNVPIGQNRDDAFKGRHGYFLPPVSAAVAPRPISAPPVTKR
jgi:hypothetical protein